MKISGAIMELSLVVAVLAACVGHAAAQEQAKPVLKIGVYDSRGITIAWAHSEEFKQEDAKLKADFEQAKAKGDTAQARKLEKEGQTMGLGVHLRGFSTAGAGDLLRKVADGLPAVAREAGVALIVSKWELAYMDPGVEVVDVTVPLAKLFKPDEETFKYLDELVAQKPVPLDELLLNTSD